MSTRVYIYFELGLIGGGGIYALHVYVCVCVF